MHFEQSERIIKDEKIQKNSSRVNFD
jgi:hypothetical protein